MQIESMVNTGFVLGEVKEHTYRYQPNLPMVVMKAFREGGKSPLGEFMVIGLPKKDNSACILRYRGSSDRHATNIHGNVPLSEVENVAMGYLERRYDGVRF